jgi:transcriptional regulator with XRE-family HTH domain
MLRKHITDDHDPVDIHIGKRIGELRSARGLDQAELADLMGVSFEQLQRFETGARRMSASMLFGFAQELDVPMEAFYDGLPGARPSAVAMCGRAHPPGETLEWRDLGAAQLLPMIIQRAEGCG